VIFEADYADTIPRLEYELYLNKYNSIHSKNSTVIQKCDELRAEIDALKKSIGEKKTLIYSEVGLDEKTLYKEEDEVEDDEEMDELEEEGEGEE
jgi:hypothetical protein